MILVITNNRIEGIHYWKEAIPPVEYLKYPHRHIFWIRCKFAVDYDDRDVEIIMTQNEIEEHINTKYGRPADFGSLSCEMIAKEILNNFDKCVSCEVLEDGYGGAEVNRRSHEKNRI